MKNLSLPLAFAFSFFISGGIHAKPSPKASRVPVMLYRSSMSKDRNVSGQWHAEAKGSGYHISFYHGQDQSNWSSSSSFSASEMKKIDTKSQYSIVRDAGQLLMTGTFDGSKGSGEYVFIPDGAFEGQLTGDGMTGLSLKTEFTCFLLNIKKDYLSEMKKRGYAITSSADLVTFSANKITPQYIDMLAGFGYRNLKIYELISARSSGVDSAYLSTLSKERLKNTSMMDLIRLK